MGRVFCGVLSGSYISNDIDDIIDLRFNRYLASFVISATPNGVYMDWGVFLPPALPGATRDNP